MQDIETKGDMQTSEKGGAKFDPSYKSKRYRDKIRSAIKELEVLLPVDRCSVQRKLDSQTVFRLTIAHFRTKLFLQAAGLSSIDAITSRCQLSEIEYCRDYSEEENVTRYTSCAIQQQQQLQKQQQQLLIRQQLQHGRLQQPQQQKQQQLQPGSHLSKGLLLNDAVRQKIEQLQSELSSVDYNQGQQLIEAFGGFLLLVTSDGTILFVSTNILQHLGFNQVDLMLRCIYGIVHPDDHQEMKIMLETGPFMSDANLASQTMFMSGAGAASLTNANMSTSSCPGYPGSASVQQTMGECGRGISENGSRSVSFLCRMKCFNGSTAGYLKMHCMGRMRSFPKVVRSQRTSNQVLFAFCRPFQTLAETDPQPDPETSEIVSRSNGFTTKHAMDLKFKFTEDKLTNVLGYTKEELIGMSLYSLVHPDDLPVLSACHRKILQNDEVQTTYMRMEKKDGGWVWLHTKCKVTTKNSKQHSVHCTHCPVREEDSTYIQQEVFVRQRYTLHELVSQHQVTDDEHPGSAAPQTGVAQGSACSGGSVKLQCNLYGGLRDDSSAAVSLHDPHGYCPSSWHATTDRHSPVFPPPPLSHSSAISHNGGGRLRHVGGELSGSFDHASSAMLEGPAGMSYPARWGPVPAYYPTSREEGEGNMCAYVDAPGASRGDAYDAYCGEYINAASSYVPDHAASQWYHSSCSENGAATDTNNTLHADRDGSAMLLDRYCLNGMPTVTSSASGMTSQLHNDRYAYRMMYQSPPLHHHPLPQRHLPAQNEQQQQHLWQQLYEGHDHMIDSQSCHPPPPPLQSPHQQLQPLNRSKFEHFLPGADEYFYSNNSNNNNYISRGMDGEPLVVSINGSITHDLANGGNCLPVNFGSFSYKSGPTFFVVPSLSPTFSLPPSVASFSTTASVGNIVHQSTAVIENQARTTSDNHVNQVAIKCTSNEPDFKNYSPQSKAMEDQNVCRSITTSQRSPGDANKRKPKKRKMAEHSNSVIQHSRQNKRDSPTSYTTDFNFLLDSSATKMQRQNEPSVTNFINNSLDGTSVLMGLRPNQTTHHCGESNFEHMFTGVWSNNTDQTSQYASL